MNAEMTFRLMLNLAKAKVATMTPPPADPHLTHQNRSAHAVPSGEKKKKHQLL